MIQETENDIMVNGAIRQQAKMELMRDPKTGARGQKRAKYWSKCWSKMLVKIWSKSTMLMTRPTSDCGPSRPDDTVR